MNAEKLESKLYSETFLRLYPEWQEVGLTPQEITILEYSHGLNGKPVLSPSEIAKEFNMPRVEVQVRKENALNKLRTRQTIGAIPRTELTKKLRCAKRELFLSQYPNWEDANLTNCQKRVVELTHGLTGEPPKSITAVGEVLGTSRQAVSKRLKAAMEKIQALHKDR